MTPPLTLTHRAPIVSLNAERSAQLNLTVTLWGQRVTGLPIDFQLQSMTDANVPEHGKRNALGLRDWSALA